MMMWCRLPSFNRSATIEKHCGIYCEVPCFNLHQRQGGCGTTHACLSHTPRPAAVTCRNLLLQLLEIQTTIQATPQSVRCPRKQKRKKHSKHAFSTRPAQLCSISLREMPYYTHWSSWAAPPNSIGQAGAPSYRLNPSAATRKLLMCIMNIIQVSSLRVCKFISKLCFWHAHGEYKTTCLQCSTHTHAEDTAGYVLPFCESSSLRLVYCAILLHNQVSVYI